MSRWSFRFALSLLIMAAAFCGTAVAQDDADFSVRPDAYVRGFGAIPVGPSITDPAVRPTLGFFNIHVNVFQGDVFGSVNYREVTPSGKLLKYAYTTKLDFVKFDGRKAHIEADGIANGYPARILFDVEDNGPVGDFFRINANGRMLTVNYIYAEGKLVLGGLEVWQKPVPTAVAAGNGAIALPTPFGHPARFGVFSFKAQMGSAGPVGYIRYTDQPYSRYNWNGTRIEVFRLEKFHAEGNTATLAGRGWLNGLPAEVVVMVEDNRDPRVPTFAPTPEDVFYIRAKTIVPPGSRMPEILYEQKGPVVKGDLFVKILAAVDTP